MEKEYNVVTLENGKKYTEIFRIVDNGKTYVFLADLKNPEDFCVRKLITENNETFIVGLDSDQEFDSVMAKFKKKYLD
jgi:hypothetical protein